MTFGYIRAGSFSNTFGFVVNRMGRYKKQSFSG